MFQNIQFTKFGYDCSERREDVIKEDWLVVLWNCNNICYSNKTFR